MNEKKNQTINISDVVIIQRTIETATVPTCFILTEAGKIEPQKTHLRDVTFDKLSFNGIEITKGKGVEILTMLKDWIGFDDTWIGEDD